MIDFVRKNIQKKKRNGELLVSSSNNFGSNTTSKGSNFTGSFLPAISNGDGSYTVDASKVTFRGSVIGEKEVTAYGVSSALPEGGDGTGTTDYNKLKNKPALNGEELTSLSKLKTINKQSLLGEGDITLEGIGSGKVIDNLTTKDPNAALSANQGVVLKDLIDKKTLDTSKYYDKTGVDTLLNDKANKKHTHTKADITDLDLSVYYGKTDVDKLLNEKANKIHTHTKADITDLDTKPYDEHIANKDIHVELSDKSNWNNKLDKSVWDKAFYFDTKNNLRVRQNLIGNGEITAYGVGVSQGGIAGLATTDYNELYNKPAINGIELTSKTKFKTINGQELIGEGDIKIEGGSGSGGSIGTTNYNDLTNKPKLNGVTLNETSELKTINGLSLIGKGNIVIGDGTGSDNQPSIGSINYNDLNNKPTLCGKELIGDTTLKTIGGSKLIGDGDISFKTINGTSIFGIGDIKIENNTSNGTTNYNDLTNKPKINGSEMIGNTRIRSIGGKLLVNYIGTDDIKIKTINGNSIFGDGDIKIETNNSNGTKNYNDLTNKPALNGLEILSNSKLRSIGGNKLFGYIGNDDIPIKTINGQTIFGEGNIEIKGIDEGGTQLQKSYNDLKDKPTLNGFELIGNTKIRSIGGNRLTGYIGNDDIPIKTINGQTIFGEGNIEIKGIDEGGTQLQKSYNDLKDKPALNGFELLSNSKLRSIGGNKLFGYIGNDDIKVKTINGNSIFGEGDIKISVPEGSYDRGNYNDLKNLPTLNGFELIGNTKIRSIGGNRLTGYIGNDDIPIKTINGHSIFGEGDIKVEAVLPDGSMDAYLNDYDRLRNKPKINGMELIANTKLRSIGGQRLINYLGNDDIPLKTINGYSIIGEGDIKIEGGSGSGGSSSGMGQYGFEIVDGYLVLVTEEQQSANPFTINSDGYLVYEING